MNDRKELPRRKFLAVAAGAAIGGCAARAGAQTPPRIRQPGVYVKEIPTLRPPIAQADMATLLLVDDFGVDHAGIITSHAEFEALVAETSPHEEAREQVRMFFDNDGQRLALLDWPADELSTFPTSAGTDRLAIRLRDSGAGLVAIPAAARLSASAASGVYAAATARVIDARAMLLVDALQTDGAAVDPQKLIDWKTSLSLGTADAAFYAPRLSSPRVASPIGASGAVAGIIARTDATRGVWKAPAGTDAVLRGATPAQSASNLQQNILNPEGVNLVRQFSSLGTLLWGARTLSSDPEWKYVPVRRLAMMIEKSLNAGLSWTVFEPNAEPLWTDIQSAIDAFLNDLFRNGGLAGSTSKEAYFVRCDRTTMTQADINAGRIIVNIGFAPLRPAEFILRKAELRARQ